MQPASAPGAPRPVGQTLNEPDRLMHVAHRALRALGCPGFLCQTHVWLDGALDEARLQDALARLAARHPVVTARLHDAGRRAEVVWRYQPDASCHAEIIALADDAEAAVHDQAAAIMARPTDLAEQPPITFHLLRRPSGRDVFVLQWVHALMDGKAPEFVLREIIRLSEMAGPSSETPGADDPGDVGVVLNRYSKWTRRKAAWRVVRSHIRLPVRSITLEPPAKPEWVFAPVRMAARTLSLDDSAAVLARSKRLCGIPNLTPAILASAYRIISRLSERPQGRGAEFRTDVPLNLRPPGAVRPIFRNYMSFISLRATFDELGNRDELTSALNRRMRGELVRQTDLGNLTWMAWLSRKPPAILEGHLAGRMQKHPLTLGFGFLGPVTAGLESFLGAAVGQVRTFNLAMSPPGLTLQANVCKERINLNVTYVEKVVPQHTAEAFLDGMAGDLVK